MKNLILVPARKGSKRLPNKNFKPFDDKFSLVDITLMQASILKGSCREEFGADYSIILSTDNTEYKNIFGNVEVDIRPDNLCLDSTPMNDVIKYYLDMYDDLELVVLLQPTSPFRSLKLITIYIKGLHGLGFSVAYTYNYKEGATSAKPNGNFYLYNVKKYNFELPLLKQNYRIPYPIVNEEGMIDIDTQEDWDRALELRKSMEDN